MSNELVNQLMWLRPQNEERPPDWRWQRAVLLEDRQSPISRFEDKTVNQIRHYLKAIKSDMPFDQVSYKFPALFEVARIHNSTSNTRWLVEALIMSNISTKEIADRFGWESEMGVKVVEFYELTKFDVRARLKFDSYIQSNILNLNPAANAASEERIWKMLGYISSRNAMGTKLLDYYISVDSMPDEVKKWYDNLIEAQLTKKTLRAILRYDPMQSPLINELFSTYHNSKKLSNEEKLSGLGTSSSETSKIHADLISSLKFTTASIKHLVPSSIEARIFHEVDNEVEPLIQRQIEAAAVKRVENTATIKPKESD